MKKTVLAGTTVAVAGYSGLTPIKGAPSPDRPVCYFTKHLQWLDFEELGMVLREAGFDGADLTVRPGGHVEPAEAGQVLPVAVRTLARYGVSVPMVVTRTSDPDQRGLDDLLDALADNGVKYYRMGYLTYDYGFSMEENISRFREILARFAEKNERYGLNGGYQNHAGTRLGASVWDLWLALRGLDARYIGCQFDVRHATYEGGRSWENDMRCIQDYITTTVVKDFYWEKNDRGEWTNRNTLMGEGMVDFDTYFALDKSLRITGPVTNHSEYPLIRADEEDLPKSRKMEIAIGRLKQDVDFTRRHLGA